MSISLSSPYLVAPPFRFVDLVTPTVITTNVPILLPDGTWQFTWDFNGSAKIVYYGRVLAITNTKSYIFDYPGQYSKSPPPLEIVPTSVFAPTELAKPYVTIQWYRIPTVSRYEVQKFVGGVWKPVFRIKNVETQVYTYNSDPLPDGSTHRYKLLAYNDVDTVAESIEYIYTIVCPVTVFEPTIDVNYTGGNISIILKQ